MKRILNSEDGIALYLVLWVMALLTVIAGEFCHVIRTEVNITRNFKEETQAYYIARAGLSRTIGELVVNEYITRTAPEDETESNDPRWQLTADIPPVPFGDGEFKVEKVNESGKVNLNKAGRELLKMMLNNFEIDDANKDIIVDSILDWRDNDHFCRANGAENSYYQSLPEPYRCKDTYFTSTEELLLVRGITPEIFYGGLKDMVSVYHDDTKAPVSKRQQEEQPDYNRININAASSQMLLSLPGMTADAVQDIIDYRGKKNFSALPEVVSVVGSDIYTAIASTITLQPSPYYTIRSTGMIKDSRTRQGVKAVVKIDRREARGYEIIQWIDDLEYRS